MKLIKMFVILFVGFSVLTGCERKNTLSINEITTSKEEQSTSEENVTKDNSELTNALENSKVSCGTIESNKEDTSISFYVMDDKINVTGKYAGESFDKYLTDDKMDAFINEIVDYTPKVQEKEYDYWPHTDEYPDMFVLFYYTVLFDNGYKYRMDGAECYPDGWDEFMKDLVEIIDLENNSF